MKDEVQRISKLVAEGRLSPEDAADLIDAFYESERSVGEAGSSSANGGSPPPPPPPPNRDPFKTFVESVERMTKEGMESVNWQEVAQHARQSAKKGMDALKTGIEDLSKGKVHLGWLTTQEEKEVTLPLVLGTGKMLKIENTCGSVKVVGGFDVGSVTARAKFRAANLEEAKTKAREYTLIVEESDQVVQIRQPDVSGLSVELEVQLAGTGSVEVRCDSGDVQILDTKGGARIISKSGNVKLRGLVGQVDIASESGDVSVEDALASSITIESKSGSFSGARLRGNIQARAASGDVRITDSSGRLMSFETVSGAIFLELDEPVLGAVSVRTVSGNASVSVPDLSDCRVSLSTLRGAVATEIELREEARTDTRVTGRLGEGTGTLDVSAVTGDVRLELRTAAVSA